MAKVTPNFSEREFACHDGSAYPPAWVASRLRPLCEALEVIRAALGGRSVRISSGYRTPAYNAALTGAAKNSQHPLGRAADIVVAGIAAKVVHATVLRLVRSGALPQVHGLGAYPTFTHVDVRPGTELAQWSGARTRNVLTRAEAARMLVAPRQRARPRTRRSTRPRSKPRR